MRAHLQFLDYMVSYLNGESPALPTQIIPGIATIKTVKPTNYALSGYNAPVQEETIRQKTQEKTFLDMAVLYNSRPDRITKTDMGKKLLGRAKVIQELLGVGRSLSSLTLDNRQRH